MIAEGGEAGLRWLGEGCGLVFIAETQRDGGTLRRREDCAGCSSSPGWRAEGAEALQRLRFADTGQDLRATDADWRAEGAEHCGGFALGRWFHRRGAETGRNAEKDCGVGRVVRL